MINLRPPPCQGGLNYPDRICVYTIEPIYDNMEVMEEMGPCQGFLNRVLKIVILKRFIPKTFLSLPHIKKSKNMKNNVGTIDKAIRILIAVAIIALYFTHIISGIFGIVLLVVAGVLILTSIAGICPLYSVLKVNTIGKKK
jgi:hypothetical protein